MSSKPGGSDTEFSGGSVDGVDQAHPHNKFLAEVEELPFYTFEQVGAALRSQLGQLDSALGATAKGLAASLEEARPSPTERRVQRDLLPLPFTSFSSARPSPPRRRASQSSLECGRQGDQ